MEFNYEEMSKQLSGIQFGVSSPEEIITNSVVEVSNPKLVDGPNTLYDPKMGIVNKPGECITCGLNSKSCPGHFGHVVLFKPILHPLFYKQIVNFLNCFCHNCSRLICNKDSLIVNGLFKYKGISRFNKIQTLLEKIDFCHHCKITHPKYTINTVEGKQRIIIHSNVKRVMTMEEIHYIFDNIINKDLSLMGINTQHLEPRNLIIVNLPILPPHSRPRVCMEGNYCDDDLSIQYAEIIKKNNNLKNGKFDTFIKRENEMEKIIFKIKSMFDNTQFKAKHSNGRVIKGIKERISSKEGIVRQNLMGKRVDMSSRSVVGPDATLKVGEVGVPLEVCEQLMIPEYVNKYNIHKLTKMVHNGIVKIVVRKNTDYRINLKFLKNKPEFKSFSLSIGDVVERQLIKGDYVLVNRQPTLHVGSIIANKVVPLKGKTFRIPVSICKSLNCD
jgi:DNA-directed RNA polymerase beta' subunit